MIGIKKLVVEVAGEQMYTCFEKKAVSNLRLDGLA